ncbi:hypothetical protein [Nocardia sp. NPDC005978]|uniref:hypothetical protein n=1 Tax=unclassified Nocardia TaxID=2637762 RepID=UPI0033AE37DF
MTKSRLALGAGVCAALAGSALAAGSAHAAIDSIAAVGPTPGAACRVGAACTIVATTTGSDRFATVEFLVGDVVVGSATPVADTFGKVTATLPWNPSASGLYQVEVRQNGTDTSMSYYVSPGENGCWAVPGSSGTGSAGSGSGGSGSFGSGSAGSGSAGSGSAGSGSGGSGSSTGSLC